MMIRSVEPSKYRVFADPKRAGEHDAKPPPFGRRTGGPGALEPRRRRAVVLAETAALVAGAAFLAFLVVDAL